MEFCRNLAILMLKMTYMHTCEWCGLIEKGDMLSLLTVHMKTVIQRMPFLTNGDDYGTRAPALQHLESTHDKNT